MSSDSTTQPIDTDISHYTIPELMLIIGIQGKFTSDQVVKKTKPFIQRYTNENNQSMVTFFQSIQQELLDYINRAETESDPAQDNSNNTQLNNWWQNQSLPQSNHVQRDKVTDRKQKVDIFNNTHVPMKSEQLGVANTFNVSVAQGNLNPNLTNITKRIINLDSQFRQVSTNNISTDYILDLSDPLYNVLALRLYSIQIPYTWYTIDTAYGNTSFWIVDGENSILVQIDSGNYTPDSLVSAINTAITNAGFSGFLVNPPVSYNPNSIKLTMNLNGGKYTLTTPTTTPFTITPITTKIVFLDLSGKLNISSQCLPASLYINQTLGWNMGYREAVVPVSLSGNTGEAVIDLNGPRYLILVIDDFNQNHINSGLIGITEYSSKLKLPSYYSPDLPYVCQNPVFPNDPLIPNAQIPQLVPSAPRTLTQSQLYTINEIIKNNDNNLNLRAKAPTTTDTFAIIPLKMGSLSTGQMYSALDGILAENRRVYFGPVNIERMRIRLLDERGNVLNLNGCDWNVTLVGELLYQY
jgi:hypothetical protein